MRENVSSVSIGVVLFRLVKITTLLPQAFINLIRFFASRFIAISTTTIAIAYRFICNYPAVVKRSGFNVDLLTVRTIPRPELLQHNQGHINKHRWCHKQNGENEL